MAQFVSIGERARLIAVDALAGLDARQWRDLARLAHEHVTGDLSVDGWTVATGAIIAQALDRLDCEGPFVGKG